MSKAPTRRVMRITREESLDKQELALVLEYRYACRLQADCGCILSDAKYNKAIRELFDFLREHYGRGDLARFEQIKDAGEDCYSL